EGQELWLSNRYSRLTATPSHAEISDAEDRPEQCQRSRKRGGGERATIEARTTAAVVGAVATSCVAQINSHGETVSIRRKGTRSDAINVEGHITGELDIVEGKLEPRRLREVPRTTIVESTVQSPSGTRRTARGAVQCGAAGHIKSHPRRLPGLEK